MKFKLADEVTYPLHVILRFELEQELVSGKLEAAGLPEAWDAKMREYLGLSTIDDPANGFRTMTLPFGGGLELSVHS